MKLTGQMDVSKRAISAYPFLLLLIILVGFCLAGFQQVIANTASDALDQGAYLSIGLAVKEEARLTDPYRQPLYAWLLAPFAQRDFSYFTWAKLLTLATGLSGVMACFVVSLHLYHSSLIAAFSAFLLAANVFFIQESATIMVEPLLGSIFLLVWLFGVKALTQSKWTQWAAGGIMTGLAYLGKESGLLWLPAWAIGTVIARKTTPQAYRKLLLFLLLSILIVSPLFIHNTVRYGTPVLAENISTMWLDDWEQFFAIGEDAKITMQTYFESHTLGEAAGRMLEGILLMGTLSVSVFVPFRLDQTLCGDWCKPYGPLIGFALLAFVLVLVFRRVMLRYWRRRVSVVLFALTFLGLYFLGASWYVPVTFDPRYVVPLLPLGYVMLGGAIVSPIKRAGDAESASGRRRERGAAILLGVAVVLWVAGAGRSCIAAGGLTNPFAQDRLANRAQLETIQALPENTANPVIVYQPSHDLPVWLIEGHSRIIAAPSDVDWPRFSTYLRDQQADYVLVTPEFFQRRQGLFRNIFYPAWPASQSEQQRFPALGIRVVPANWELVYANQSMPGPYYVFRVMPLPDTASARHIALGDAEVAAGNWGRAGDEYTLAVSKMPAGADCTADCRNSRAQVLRSLGQIAMLQDHDREAQGYFDEALALQPDSIWLRALSAELLNAAGNRSAALAEYDVTLRLAGEDWANVPAALAWTNAREGHLDTAIQGYREALERSPDNPWYQLLLGQALVDYGLPGEAMPLYQSILARKIPWPFVRDRLADAEHAQNGTAMGDETSGVRETTAPCSVAFEDGLRFTRYHIGMDEYADDGQLKIALYWVPPRYAGRQYRVHAKLMNAIYGVWGEGQGDLHRQGIPGGAWANTAELRDTIAVQVNPGTPPGAYRLTIAVQDLTREQWLDTTSREEASLGPIELPLRVLSPAQLDMPETRAATFGDQIELLGYKLDGEPAGGKAVLLTLFWQSLTHPDTAYTVFTHLTDDSGRLWAQQDNEPANGFHPTTSWQPGEIVRDPYLLFLPEALPVGSYTLQIGLYDAQHGQRLQITESAIAPHQDSLVIETFQLK